MSLRNGILEYTDEKGSSVYVPLNHIVSVAYNSNDSTTIVETTTRTRFFKTGSNDLCNNLLNALRLYLQGTFKTWV